MHQHSLIICMQRIEEAGRRNGPQGVTVRSFLSSKHPTCIPDCTPVRALVYVWEPPPLMNTLPLHVARSVSNCGVNGLGDRPDGAHHQGVYVACAVKWNCDVCGCVWQSASTATWTVTQVVLRLSFDPNQPHVHIQRSPRLDRYKYVRSWCADVMGSGSSNNCTHPMTTVCALFCNSSIEGASRP